MEKKFIYRGENKKIYSIADEFTKIIVCYFLLVYQYVLGFNQINNTMIHNHFIRRLQ